MLLGLLLRHLVRRGTLVVIEPGGRAHRFGDETGLGITMRLRDRSVSRKLFFNPRLQLGEAFMNGTVTFDDATIYDFLNFIGINLTLAPRGLLTPLYNGFGHALRFIDQYNPLGRARQNVAHHYDLSDTLYDLFLDADRQYSCAYFNQPATSRSRRHRPARSATSPPSCCSSPGARVLDIGCGWGGLALYLARECNVVVTGLTLSKEQLAVAERRAPRQGSPTASASSSATTASMRAATTASSPSVCSSMSASCTIPRSSVG